MSRDPEERAVVVTDVRMPFWSMVVFMVKWAVASIPAIIILGALWTAVWMLAGGVLAGLFGGGHLGVNM